MLEEQILSVTEWRRRVRERDGFKCVRCGSPEADVYFLVPRSLGGRTTLANGITLCQKCRLDSSERPGEAAAEFKRVRYNLPLPKDFLYDLNLLSMAVGRSVADIIREVVAEAVFTDRWAKLETIPMNGSPPTRTNFWMARPVFEKFEEWCKTRGLTVATALRSLLWSWAQEIQKGDKHGGGTGL
jgi:hypothetical protein